MAGTSWPGMTVKVPLVSMMDARLRMWGHACVVRYRSITSERHRPTSWITFGSMLPHSRAMAPPALVDRAETSSGRNPREGPIKVAETRIVAVTRVEVTKNHLLLALLAARKTAHSGVALGA
jgi:hypothetical protein